MSIKRICLCSFVFTVLLVMSVSAQQTSKPDKKPRTAPSLETDDVVPVASQVKTEKPVSETKPAEAKQEGSKGTDKDSDKSDDKKSVKKEEKSEGDKPEVNGSDEQKAD